MGQLAVAAVDVAPGVEQVQDRLAFCGGDGVHRDAARRGVAEAADFAAVPPTATTVAVELEHRARASCCPARLDGAIEEVQQGGLHTGFDTRGHAGGHPQRSFPSNNVTFTAISLSASPSRATSPRAIANSGSAPSARAPGRDDANASRAPRLATSRARMIVERSTPPMIRALRHSHLTGQHLHERLILLHRRQPPLPAPAPAPRHS